MDILQIVLAIVGLVSAVAACVGLWVKARSWIVIRAPEGPSLAVIRTRMRRYPKLQSTVFCMAKNVGLMAASELHLRIACCPIGKPDLLAIVFDDRRAKPLAAGEATSFESEPFQEPQDIGPKGLHVVFAFTYSDPTREWKRRQQCDFRVCDIAAWQPGDSLREATVQEREEIKQSSDAREKLAMDKW